MYLRMLIVKKLGNKIKRRRGLVHKFKIYSRSKANWKSSCRGAAKDWEKLMIWWCSQDWGRELIPLIIVLLDHSIWRTLGLLIRRIVWRRPT